MFKNGKSALSYIYIVLVVILSVLPIAMLFFASLGKDNQGIFMHLVSSGIIFDYAKNTILLSVGVVALSLILGVTSALIFTFYEFKGRVVLSFFVLLSFAMPSWIIAHSYTYLLDYKTFFGYQIPLRSLVGAIVIISFSTYPYVYLVTVIALKRQSTLLLEASYCLGCSSFRFFTKIALPLIRPAIAASAFICAMEAISDYGTVKYFSLPVLSYGIEDIWLNMGSIVVASRIAVFTVFIIIVLLYLEDLSRKKLDAYGQNNDLRAIKKYTCQSFWSKLLLYAFIITPSFIAFVIPFMAILKPTLARFFDFGLQNGRVIQSFINSIFYAGTVAFLATLVSLIFTWQIRSTKNFKLRKFLSICTVSYSIPGIIFALGAMKTAYLFDVIANKAFEGVGLIFVSSALILVYALVVRFFVLSAGNLDSGLARISQSTIDSAKILSKNNYTILSKVYVPLMLPYLIISFVMVFIDTIKELAIASLIRPHGLELLSLYIWQFASLDQFEEAAPASFLLTSSCLVALSALWYYKTYLDKRGC